VTDDPPETSPFDRALAIEKLLACDFSQLGDIVARREADLREKTMLPSPPPVVAPADRPH
jgi:hypothetical protein